MPQSNKWQNRICLLMGYLFLNAAYANQPFLTQDPVPEDYKSLDVYLYTFLNKTNYGSVAALPGLEFDYGLVPNLEVDVILPMVASWPASHYGPKAYGYGDTQLLAVYRFLNDTKHSLQAAISPVYLVPTGNAPRGLGNGKPVLTIPIDVQKSWGSWTTYGSVGYAINYAAFGHNYWFGGWVLMRQLNEKWMIGAEIYSQQSTTSRLNTGTSLLNLGGSYAITKSLELQVSLGHSFLGASNLIGYFGFDWTC